MNSQNKKLISLGLTAAILVVGLVALNGCKKSEPESTTNQQVSEQVMKAEPMAAEAEKMVAEAIEQKTCPIMGGPIDKNIFVEYKGKKVYFCCAGCESKFKEAPEKYLAKLPQFSE